MTKITSFLISFFLLSSLFLEAQELPPIKNLTPENYWAANQNWMLSQSESKDIYVANAAGLLEFNGSKWSLYPTPNSSEMRSVKVVNDLIFTGFYMDFGYWTKDNHGNMEYHSLVDKLKIPLIIDEDFWKIEEFQGHVIFQSLDRIYIYNPINESFSIIEAKNKRAGIYLANDNLFFQKLDKGIFKIDNGEERLISDNPTFQNHVLVGVFNLDERILFLTEDGKFYFLDGDTVSRWHIKADDDLISEYIYCSIQLDDDSFILGTISSGIIHIDKSGEVLEKINKQKGLNNNTVLSIFEDQENNLWLGLDHGISLVNLKSHFKYFTDLKGELGVVYAAIEFKNNFYIGTNQGLFYRSNKLESKFKLVPNTEGQVWFLEEIYGELFCGHNDGTFLISSGKSTKISEFPGTWSIKKIKNQQKLLMQGNFNGLSILEKKNGQWKFRNVIDKFDLSSRFFEFIGENEILLNHEREGLFKLTFDNDFNEVIQTNNEFTHGYGSSLITFNKNIYHSSNSEAKVLKYDFKKKTFFIDTLMTQKFYGEHNKIKGVLISSPNSNTLWGLSDNQIIVVSPGKFKNNLETTTIAISGAQRRSLGVIGFENIAFLGDGEFLIGASNGYAVLDINELKKRDFYIRINTIYKNAHKISPSTIPLANNSKLKHDENYLEFEFSVPEYSNTAEAEYQYLLEGENSEWSMWSNESSISFYNLSPGNYTFKVRSRLGNDLSENIASHTFTIAKPWYLSRLAWFTYITLVFFISILIHRTYKTYYSKRHQRALLKNERELKIERLKNEREMMEIKNNVLIQDNENKSNELARTTMNLVRKNEFLSVLKSELKKIEGEANLKYIFKIIDQNLNNTEDWELFKEAFNNVDKNFFKKLKIRHPNLSPNDLKLCAYLRMNLSSKEISPILNISTKSVDIKRSRLRKKMCLARNVSISNYLFEI